MNLAEPWTEAAKLAEYRRATWRRHVLGETARYDDAPLTVLACRQPPLGTPEESGHRDAEDAHGRLVTLHPEGACSVIPDLDDERPVAADYTPMRSALTVAAEIREELAAHAIWEIRVDCDGAVTVDMLRGTDADEAADILGLMFRLETRRDVGYRGTWHGCEIRVVTAKPSRLLRAWLRVTGRLK